MCIRDSWRILGDPPWGLGGSPGLGAAELDGSARRRRRHFRHWQGERGFLEEPDPSPASQVRR
eukprot:3278104-Pyramimonas_sp.AAC.1